MNDKIKNILVTAVFSLFFVGAFIAVLIKSPDEYSVSERRKLSQFPEISVNAVLDGSFFNDFADYAADQLPLREPLRKIKAFTMYNILLQKDNNDIYVVNGQVAKLEYPLNENSVIEATEKIEYICKEYLADSDIYCSVIPDKNFFLAEKNGYPSIDYKKMMDIFTENLDGVTYIDIFDTLKITDYYPTDTHWDQAKILNTAEKIASQMGNTLTAEYEKNTLAPYYGVYYGQSALSLPSDTITYLTNAFTEASTAKNLETNKEIPIYTVDKFTGTDPYDIFLDGASPLIEISNPLISNGKELIIFRDSFGSSIAPLFLESYAKITLIDTRYISSELLGEYVKFSDQDVLFLYNTAVLNNSNMLK